jgi:pyruvate-ferredoxin/flavodoxin oxidoreductase
VQEYFLQQTRFKMLTKSKPEDAERLWKMAQTDVEQRYKMYEYMAARKTDAPPTVKDVAAARQAPVDEKTPALTKK